MGIRAELAISSPAGCPIAQITTETDTTADNISMTLVDDSAETVTEEFMLDTDDSMAAIDQPNGLEDVNEIFSYGSKHIYRFHRTREDCACERVHRQSCPITDTRAEDGTLFLTIHTEGIEQLREVLTDLRERFSGVRVKRLLHSNTDDTTNDLILLDRSELTDRQREVLETAHEMGYFEHGQGSNAGEVADALEINSSTFSEHLRAAQRKLLRTILTS